MFTFSIKREIRTLHFAVVQFSRSVNPAVLEKIGDITTKWKGPNLGLSSLGTYFEQR